MARASDIMNRKVIFAHPDTCIEEVVRIFKENNIRGLPVVDTDNKVVGVISESDISEYSKKLHVTPLIGFSGWVSPYTDVSQIASFNKGIELLSSAKVEEVMSKKVVAAKEMTTFHEIVALMKKSSVNRIPVVDNENRLVGIITRDDLLTYLAEKEE